MPVAVVADGAVLQLRWRVSEPAPERRPGPSDELASGWSELFDAKDVAAIDARVAFHIDTLQGEGTTPVARPRVAANNGGLAPPTPPVTAGANAQIQNNGGGTSGASGPRVEHSSTTPGTGPISTLLNGGGTDHIPAHSPEQAMYFAPLPLDDESYPDLVAVRDVHGYDCSGVALSTRYVITARHCGAVTRVAIASDVGAPVFATGIDRVVVASDPHIDLELAHTVDELPVTPHPRRHADDSDAPGGDLRVIGFGISNFRDGSGFGIKRFFDTAAYGWGCDGSRPRTTGCVPGAELVLPATTGHDTCNGDSGGAVLELDDGGNEWRLIAITSRAANPTGTVCGQGGIYERLDAAGEWIDGILKGQ